jgi:hypothetical protein
MGFMPSKRRDLLTHIITQVNERVILQVALRKMHLLRENYLNAKRIYRWWHRNSQSKQNIFCRDLTQISTRILKSNNHFLQTGSTAPWWDFSNIDILERFQSKVLRIITDALWYMPNTMIRRDLQILPVRQEVRNYSITYRHRLDNHPNRLAKSLLPGHTLNRRLKRCHPADLQTRF